MMVVFVSAATPLETKQYLHHVVVAVHQGIMVCISP
jgi:hypothetical protein